MANNKIKSFMRIGHYEYIIFIWMEQTTKQSESNFILYVDWIYWIAKKIVKNI